MKNGRYDCSKLPIFLHTIETAQNLRGWTLKDGIHYAVNEIRDEDRLRADIVQKLDRALNGFDCPPAGYIHGVLSPAVCHSNRLTHVDIDEIYRMGMNPIRYVCGTMVIWGQNFIYEGRPMTMFTPGIHPGTYEPSAWFDRFYDPSCVRRYSEIWETPTVPFAPKIPKIDYLAAIHDICKAEL
jgi:hypothetical protein